MNSMRHEKYRNHHSRQRQGESEKEPEEGKKQEAGQCF